MREIRIRANDGAYRVIYTAKVGNAIYVLHAFRKKHRRWRNAILNLPGSD